MPRPPRPPMHMLIDRLISKDPKGLNKAIQAAKVDPGFDRSLRRDGGTQSFRLFRDLDDGQRERLSHIIYEHYVKPIPIVSKMDEAKKNEVIMAMSQHGVFAVDQAVRRGFHPGDEGFNEEVGRWHEYLARLSFPFSPQY
jgi:hypothetical protein